jgi:HEAT repeat protein
MAEHDANGTTRGSACEALGKLGDRRAVNVLLDMAEHDANGTTRGSACEALGKLGDRRAVNVLLHMAEHDADGGMRVRAVEALGKLGDRRAVVVLLRIAESNASTRASAVEALGTLGDPCAVQGLLRIAQNDADHYTRWCAFEAMGKMGEPSAVDGLVDELLGVPSNESWCNMEERTCSVLENLPDVRAEAGLLRIAELNGVRGEMAWEALDALSEKLDRVIIRGDAWWWRFRGQTAFDRR